MKEKHIIELEYTMLKNGKLLTDFNEYIHKFESEINLNEVVKTSLKEDVEYKIKLEIERL